MVSFPVICLSSVILILKFEANFKEEESLEEIRLFYFKHFF